MPSANRPLSPHLQVYRPQLTSVLSISHRVTGLALSAGMLMLVWQLIAAASGPDAFDTFQAFAGSWVGIVVLLGWSIALFYHLSNGIRHLIWDTGAGLDLPSAYRSGMFVLASTVVLTVVTWVAALAIKGGF
jgi:succinate dehydrogenase / fumarate reductase cytochrome b subunit